MIHDPIADLIKEIDDESEEEEQRDFIGEIHRSLHLLPEDEQKIIWWYFMEGWTLQQCADALNVVVSTVYKKKALAIKHLQKILGEIK